MSRAIPDETTVIEDGRLLGTRIGQFASRFGVDRITIGIEEDLVDDYRIPARYHVVRCLPGEADPSCSARAHAVAQPPGYMITRVHLRDVESHREALVTARVTSRRFVELAWMREGLTRPNERAIAQRLAADARMTITISGLTYGLLIRATCDLRPL